MIDLYSHEYFMGEALKQAHLAYEDGEILLVKTNVFTNAQPRKCFFFEDKIMLCPINPEYETKTVNSKDVKILGKIKKVIKTLD